VQPAASIASDTSEDTMRAVFDRTQVGKNMGIDYSSDHDFFIEGDCDVSFLELARACGWEEDLLTYKHLMSPKSQALFD